MPVGIGWLSQRTLGFNIEWRFSVTWWLLVLLADACCFVAAVVGMAQLSCCVQLLRFCSLAAVCQRS